MKTINNYIQERLVISKTKNSNKGITFGDLYNAVEKYQHETDSTFKAVYLWPITKTPKLLNFSYNAYLESFFVEYKGDNMITVQFLGRNKRKTRLYIDSDEELRRTFDEKTIEELYNYFTTFVK